MEFANPYASIPPAPSPTSLFARRDDFGVGAISVEWLPPLTGSRRYRIFNVVLIPGGGGSTQCLISETPGGLIAGALVFACNMNGAAGTPFPVAQPPTGTPLTVGQGLMCASANISAATCLVYSNISYAIE